MKRIRTDCRISIFFKGMKEHGEHNFTLVSGFVPGSGGIWVFLNQRVMVDKKEHISSKTQTFI